MSDPIKRLEGIAHSYAQHIDMLEVETERGKNRRGRRLLRIDFELTRPSYAVRHGHLKELQDGKRALFIRRLMREDGVWASRLGTNYVVLLER